MYRTSIAGFTLTELLVVIVIISMLASMLFPTFSSAREKARQTVCVNNQHQIALSMMMWTQDHDETMPDAASVWRNMPDLHGVLVCPTLGSSTPNGYVYNSGVSSLSLGQIPRPVQTLLTADGIHSSAQAAGTYDNVLYSAQDMDMRHSGRAVCGFVDGHVGTNMDITGFSYLNNFAQTPGAEWSVTTTDTTPVGSRKFLGQFGNQSVSLSLAALPLHAKIILGCDLFVIRSWQGNTGPHQWQVTADSKVLLTTTFANATAVNQAYPDLYPGGSHPGCTNASEVNTLGYQDSTNTPLDSVYHYTNTFTHSASNLVLTFKATGLSSLTTTSWGLANMSVVGE